MHIIPFLLFFLLFGPALTAMFTLQQISHLFVSRSNNAHSNLKKKTKKNDDLYIYAVT